MDTGTGKYLNAANNTEHEKGATGGVNLANYAEDDNQVFIFEVSDNGYSLKTRNGYYIYCQQWNVDALTKKSVLKFVDASNGCYYIMNGDKYFKVENVNGTYYPFCDAPESNKATWKLEVAVPLPSIHVKAEINGLTENNPNTHLGVVRTSDGSQEITTKLNTEEGTLFEVKYKGDNVTIDFTRHYRGFEFQGYSLGDKELGKAFTLTPDIAGAITESNPLIAKFNTTKDATLFYDDDPKSYRIPAIGKTSTGRLIAVSDYRHSLDDLGRDVHGTGTHRIDLVIRTSDDNGTTWREKQTIAQGSGTSGANDCGYGDAAIATIGEKVLVMAAAGDVCFPYGSATAHNRAVRIFSEDNGKTWEKKDISETLFISSTATIPNGYTAFFGSGKLAVDENFNNTGKARVYGGMLIKNAVAGNCIYVIYSDDLGLTWKVLGGGTNHVTTADEPKVEILPNGQILLSARRVGGRHFNVFTYSNKETGDGTWSTNLNGCNNGGNNGTNGEIYCVDAIKDDGTAVKLLLQSQPKGGSGQYDRKDVTIWYKDISADATYTTSDIANNWTQGIQVSTQQSSYSAMIMQDDGKIALFFEEAPCYGDDYTKGYCMVYVPLTINDITCGNYNDMEIEQDNNTPSSIKEVFGKNTSRDIYDLAGRKVESPTKGIYIVSGKKIRK